jgi:hypothetical protein
MEVEVTLLNDKSHFSEEDAGIFTLTISMIVIYWALLGSSVYSYFKEAKESMSWVHPLGILIMAICLELFHLGCMTIHYWVYSYDGEGVFVFYVFATISKIVS